MNWFKYIFFSVACLMLIACSNEGQQYDKVNQASQQENLAQDFRQFQDITPLFSSAKIAVNQTDIQKILNGDFKDRFSTDLITGFGNYKYSF